MLVVVIAAYVLYISGPWGLGAWSIFSISSLYIISSNVYSLISNKG